MVAKKSGKALQLEEGLERTDNGMKLTSFPEVPMINQKNYYTEYQKRDDQLLVFRLATEKKTEKMIRIARDKDRALAQTGGLAVPGPDVEEGEGEDDDVADDDFDPSKVIVIHPGSQNLRIGFASDALPKTVTMCYAHRNRPEYADEEARPKRQKKNAAPDQQFEEEWAKKYTKMSNELKVDMRANRRKVLPNSKDLVVNFNRRSPPELVPEHNDAVRVDWTDPKSGEWFLGAKAQRIDDDSTPSYRIQWPIQHGRTNEHDFRTTEQVHDRLDDILRDSIKQELGLSRMYDWMSYSCVCIIPDLYDKKYVEYLLKLFITEYEFVKVCFIQESLAATFGAAITNACVVDVGAQKTSIACVEDGMIIEDSRINLKYGGYDVTETFLKMMLHDNFPYPEINLLRRYDFLLAEELKIMCCTLSQANISVQPFNFHLRVCGEPTRKYNFKAYDEVILAPMGFYDPVIFDNSDKLRSRRALFDRSTNFYDPDTPDDPVSAAQIAILSAINPAAIVAAKPFANNNEAMSTPAKEKSSFNFLSRLDGEANGSHATPGTSNAGSPVPEGASTPAPFVFGANGNGQSDSPAPFQLGTGSHTAVSPIPGGVPARTPTEVARVRDSILPIAPLDQAIITSIQHAAKGDEKKLRDLFGGIMVVGGGAKTPYFGQFLEERLKRIRPDLAEKILVGTSPREMDGQVVCWKGAAVMGMLQHTNDTWISKKEYDMLNSRILHQKVAWNW